VSDWAAIALNLVSMGAFFDVAVRDLLIAVAAFSLARLTEARGSAIHSFTHRQELATAPAGMTRLGRCARHLLVPQGKMCSDIS
jgi:hypothetical protein